MEERFNGWPLDRIIISGAAPAAWGSLARDRIFFSQDQNIARYYGHVLKAALIATALFLSACRFPISTGSIFE